MRSSAASRSREGSSAPSLASSKMLRAAFIRLRMSYLSRTIWA